MFLPTAALAQSAIAGVVRDPSGAVMPGVTVEAASPALIETDAIGRHRRRRAVQDRRSAAGRLHRSLHAAGVSHGEARRHRAAGELHGDDQRRAARRRARGNGHRLGPVAGRRRAERGAAAGAQPGRCSTRCRPAAASRRSARCCRARALRCRTSAAPPACRTAISPCTASDGRDTTFQVDGMIAERHRRRRQRPELLQRGDVRGNQLPDERASTRRCRRAASAPT